MENNNNITEEESRRSSTHQSNRDQDDRNLANKKRKSTNPHGVTGALSCTPCRQLKQKCDFSNPNEACSRCEKYRRICGPKFLPREDKAYRDKIDERREFQENLIRFAELREERGQSFRDILALMNPDGLIAPFPYDGGMETNRDSGSTSVNEYENSMLNTVPVYPSPETGSHPATSPLWEFPMFSAENNRNANHPDHNRGANVMTETPSHLIPSANQFIGNDFAMGHLNFPGMEAYIIGDDEATVTALNVQTRRPQIEDYGTSSFSTNSDSSALAGIYFDPTLKFHSNEFQG